MSGRAVLAGLLGALLLAGVALAATWRPAVAVAGPVAPSSFPADSVARGAALAHMGDCAVCHTAPGGRAYAGGLPVKTPFGVVYATNITPDPRTGLGLWSEPAFARAMREGVARNGAHLYPAFPYTHYTGLSDGDLRDLYAFLMTRTPVQAAAPANRLIPPLGFRPLLAGWKLLFFRPHRVAPDPARSPEWNRGRYLAEALGHCGACHSPRNPLGAEVKSRPYDGGWAEGWWSPPLNARSPAARAWTVDRLATYLRTGLSPDHAAAAGPMGPVTRELSRAPEADVRAIAVYVADLMGAAPAGRGDRPTPDKAEAALQAHPQGAALYAGACASCHEAGAGMMVQGRPPLPWGTPLHEPTPRDTVQIVLQGLKPPVARAGPYMPAFGDTFTDAQVADIAAYLRARFSDEPPWRDLPGEVRKARKEGAS